MELMDKALGMLKAPQMGNFSDRKANPEDIGY